MWPQKNQKNSIHVSLYMDGAKFGVNLTENLEQWFTFKQGSSSKTTDKKYKGFIPEHNPALEWPSQSTDRYLTINLRENRCLYILAMYSG